VAAHLETEILLVDEVLAVGDTQFQKKCLGKMGKVAKEGRTVLFVSHNMGSLQQLCSKGYFLDKGKLVLEGDIDSCIKEYLVTNQERLGTILAHAVRRTDHITVNQITVNDCATDELEISYKDDFLKIEVEVEVHTPTKVAIEAKLFEISGSVIGTFCPAHFKEDNLFFLDQGKYRLTGKLRMPALTKGTFYLSIFLTNPSVVGQWDIPYGVRLVADSIPMISYGAYLENKSGHGAIIIDGCLECRKEQVG
jgi:lipopolysaccharide transport system ATP-binding protein